MPTRIRVRREERISSTGRGPEPFRPGPISGAGRIRGHRLVNRLATAPYPDILPEDRRKLGGGRLDRVDLGVPNVLPRHDGPRRQTAALDERSARGQMVRLKRVWKILVEPDFP